MVTKYGVCETEMTTPDGFALGLRWLHERDGRADEAAVWTQIDLACAPWTQALRTLHSYPDVVWLLQTLYPEVVPHLIHGSQISPVHHIAHVVNFMATITLGEQLSPTDVKRGVLGALFHDIGIGASTRPKISERMIGEATDPEQRADLRREGIASRCEHMEKGAAITADILRPYRRQHYSLLTTDDVVAIVDIVATHDNGKIPLMDHACERHWYLRPGPEDWLKQCHWEADALWMLCPDGLLVDMQRRHAVDTPAERQAQFLFNEQLHRDIVMCYAATFDADGTFAHYGFRQGLLYRSGTGYQLAQQMRHLQGLPNSSLPCKDDRG